MKIISNENKIYFLIFIFLYLLIYNVGAIGEIHSARNQTLNINFYEFIFPNWENLNFYVLNPLGYYLDYGYAKYFSYNKFLTAVYKTSIIFISFLFYTFFLNKFLNFKYTIFLTFLIFLSPNSDSLIFSSTHRYLLGSSLVLLSYAFVNDKKYLATLFFLILSILICYISIIFIFGFILYFLFNKKFNYSSIYIIILLLFLIYYFSISFFLEFSKFSQNYNFFTIMNKSVIIIGSYIDAGLGISFFIKIFYIFTDYKLPFIIVFISLLFLVFYIYNKNKSINLKNKFTQNLINYDLIQITFYISLTSIIVFILSFGYPFIVFGLGNRTNLFINIFSYSLIFFFLLKYSSHNLIFYSISIFFCFLLTAGIISNFHWKNFSKNSDIIITNIKKNCDKISLNKEDINLIFLFGQRYSILGNFDHIEFLAPPWVTNSFCNQNNVNLMSISNEILYNQNVKSFYNLKYNTKYNITDKHKIYIYNLTNNFFEKSDIETIKKLNSNYNDTRHWYIYFDKFKKIIKKISNGKYG